MHVCLHNQRPIFEHWPTTSLSKDELFVMIHESYEEQRHTGGTKQIIVSASKTNIL